MPTTTAQVLWLCGVVPRLGSHEIRKHRQIVIGLLVQHVHAEALLLVAFAVLGTQPPRGLRKLLGERRDALRDLDRDRFPLR